MVNKSMIYLLYMIRQKSSNLCYATFTSFMFLMSQIHIHGGQILNEEYAIKTQFISSEYLTSEYLLPDMHFK